MSSIQTITLTENEPLMENETRNTSSVCAFIVAAVAVFCWISALVTFFVFLSLTIESKNNAFIGFIVAPVIFTTCGFIAIIIANHLKYHT